MNLMFQNTSHLSSPNEMSHLKQNTCHLLNFDGWLRLKDKLAEKVKKLGEKVIKT